MEKTRKIPDGFSEEDLRDPAYSDPLAQATAPMVLQCQELLAEIQQPDFNGGQRLDCTKNGALASINDFFEELALYEEGRVPFFVTDDLISLTDQLIAAELVRYPTLGPFIQSISQAFRRSAILWHRRHAFPRLERAIYLKQLFNSRNRIIDAICTFNSQLFAKDTTDSKVKHHHGKHSRKRRFTDKQERIILEFVECPEFDSGREINGHTCYDVKRAASAWAKFKHARGLPKTAEDFRKTYKSIIDRHRRKARLHRSP